MTIGRKLRLAYYGRISDADDEIGVDRQLRAGKAAAARHTDDWDVVAWLTDNDRSAKDEDISRRPDFVTLLGMIERDELDGVLTFHPDRISRNGTVIENFIKLAAPKALRIITSEDEDIYNLKTASGRKNFRNAGVSAIYESEHRAERVKLWIGEQIEEGKLNGGFRPYGIHRASKSRGKDKDGKLIPWEDENGDKIPQHCPSCGEEMKTTVRKGSVRAVIEVCPVEVERLTWFAEQWANPTATLYGMASYANTAGWPTVRGGEWRAESLKSILKKDLLFGKRNGVDLTVIDGPLLPAETENALRLTIDLPRPRNKEATPTLLGGLEILKCGVCGANMQANQKNKGSLRYGCIKRPGVGHHCGRISVMRERCNDRVRDLLLPALKLWRENSPKAGSADAERDLGLAQRKLKVLTDEWDDIESDMPEDEYKRRSRDLRQQIKALEAKVAQAAITDDAIPHDGTAAEWLAWWSGISRDRQRKILKGMVAKIEVNPSPAGRIFDPNRITMTYGEWADPIRELILALYPIPAVPSVKDFKARLPMPSTRL